MKVAKLKKIKFNFNRNCNGGIGTHYEDKNKFIQGQRLFIGYNFKTIRNYKNSLRYGIGIKIDFNYKNND